MTSHWWNTIMQYHELFNEIWKWKVYNKSGYTAGLNINTETRTMSGKKSSYVRRKLHIGHSRVKTQKHLVNIGLPCSGFSFHGQKEILAIFAEAVTWFYWPVSLYSYLSVEMARSESYESKRTSRNQKNNYYQLHTKLMQCYNNILAGTLVYISVNESQWFNEYLATVVSSATAH